MLRYTPTIGLKSVAAPPASKSSRQRIANDLMQSEQDYDEILADLTMPQDGFAALRHRMSGADIQGFVPMVVVMTWFDAQSYLPGMPSAFFEYSNRIGKENPP